MSYKYLKSEDIENKTVLLRVDFNEEVDEKGCLVDDFRIQAILPTLEFLKKHHLLNHD